MANDSACYVKGMDETTLIYFLPLLSALYVYEFLVNHISAILILCTIYLFFIFSSSSASFMIWSHERIGWGDDKGHKILCLFLMIFPWGW